MTAKRKDKQGRILKAGESQRKDGTYQFRFKQSNGKWVYVYAPTLSQLREKAQTIMRFEERGGDYAQGSISVYELTKRYLALKTNLRPNSISVYQTALNRVREEPIGARPIRDIKVSDAKSWFLDMSKRGLSRKSISVHRAVMRSAFQMAYEEDVIPKNPFTFNLDFLPHDGLERKALTLKQQQSLFAFLSSKPEYRAFYNRFIVLLGTGLRVSELAGLTKRDLDFENLRIRVDHQLQRKKGGGFYVSPPKSAKGNRYIPMVDEVYDALQEVLRDRPKLRTECIVDGYAGFVFITKDGLPQYAAMVEKEFEKVMLAYAAEQPELVPKITPHVLRHTFCTNMANVGVKPDTLQYIMGHASINLTLNVYRHMEYEVVENAIKNLPELPILRFTAER